MNKWIPSKQRWKNREQETISIIHFITEKKRDNEQRIKEYINTVSIINRMQRMAQNKKQRTKGDREHNSIKTIDGRGWWIQLYSHEQSERIAELEACKEGS